MTKTNPNSKRALTAMFLSVAIFLSACGGGAATSTPAPSATATRAPQASSAAPSAAAASSAAASAVARAAAASSVAPSAAAASSAAASAPAAASASAAGGTPAASGTRQVKADNGMITVPANPQRIAAIGNASLPFIDLGGKPLGVTTIQPSLLELVPKEQKAIYDAATNLGPSGGAVDLEKLASLKPDLIMAQMPTADFDKIKDKLQSIAPTVYYGLGTEWKAFADGLAAAGNRTEALAKQKADFEARIKSIKETYRETIANTTFVALDRYDSSAAGVFVVTHIGCVEIAKDEIGLNLPARTAGATEERSFEQIGDLDKYGAILYPVDAAGQPKTAFAPVVGSNSWKALPAVTSGRALGIYCPGNNSYGAVLTYLGSLENALKALPKK